MLNQHVYPDRPAPRPNQKRAKQSAASEAEPNWSQYHSLESLRRPHPLALHDGTQVILRPASPTDVLVLRAFLERLSPESVYFRFHQHRPELPPDLAWQLAHSAPPKRVTVVATLDNHEDALILAEASYALETESLPLTAELNGVVEDRYQGLGLGKHLLKYLISYGRLLGLDRFVTRLHHHNYRAQGFLRRSGLPVESEMDWQAGLEEVQLRL